MYTGVASLEQRRRRWERVEALTAQGLSAPAIAARLQVHPDTVRRDRRLLRAGRAAPAGSSRLRAMRARRRLVAGLMADGFSVAEIAVRVQLEGFDVHLETVRRDVKALQADACGDSRAPAPSPRRPAGAGRPLMTPCGRCGGTVMLVEDYIPGEGLVHERRCVQCHREPAADVEDRLRRLHAVEQAEAWTFYGPHGRLTRPRRRAKKPRRPKVGGMRL